MKRFPLMTVAVLRWLALALALTAAVTACGGGAGGGTTPPPPPPPPTGVRVLTSVPLSQLMSPGINLGNTLEAIPAETSWGNPMTTQATMDGYKAAGFKTVRIPVSYSQYADPNNNISATWLARVKQVVD